MSLKDTLLIIDMMQEEQFKKHALWIAQMKQSHMITQAKRLDNKLNILAGQSIVDDKKGEILQREIDLFLEYDSENQKIKVN